MLEKNIAFIANYLWKESIKNIDDILSETDKSKFNIIDYYYLTSIHYMHSPNFGDIAEQLSLTKPAVSAMVKRLEKIDFVCKKQSSQDKRIFHLELTSKGKQIIEGDNNLYMKLTSLIDQLSSKEQLEQLGVLMNDVVNILKNEKSWKENL